MTDELYWLPEIVDWRERFAAISRESPDQAWRDIVSLARTRLNFSQHERLAKAITRLCGGSAVKSLPTKPIRLAVLGSSTLDHLLAAVRVGAARRDLWVDLYTPAYGQYRQELEDQASRLYKFQPTTILFAVDALQLVSGISGPLSAAGTKS